MPLRGRVRVHFYGDALCGELIARSGCGAALTGILLPFLGPAVLLPLVCRLPVSRSAGLVRPGGDVHLFHILDASVDGLLVPFAAACGKEHG